MSMNQNAPAKHAKSSGYLHLQSPEGLDYQLEIADLGVRAHAFILDWHIRLLLALSWLLVIGYGFKSFIKIQDLFSQDRYSWSGLLLLISTACIYFLYPVVMEIALCGRTPGKRMAGVRLVTLDGRTPGIGAILLRNLFRIIDSLPLFYLVGILTVTMTRHRVRIGDLAAGLVLVYDKTVEQKQLHRMTDLAMHSWMKPEDQALLLDLLDRWPELSSENRVRLGERFLQRIGKGDLALSPDDKPDQSLKSALQQLLVQSGEAS